MLGILVASLLFAFVIIVTIAVAVAYANGNNNSNAIKALEGKECPMLPSSESMGPVQQMRCHDPECQDYLFGNQAINATMEKKCWEPAKDQTLGSLVS